MGFLDRLRGRATGAAAQPSSPPVQPPVSAAPAGVSSPRWSCGPARTRDVPLSELQFCVIDVETTGLSPQQERIVEIACVRIDAAGNVIDELSTLIDPEGSVGPTFIHGISQDDVRGAPRFADVAPDVLGFISSSAVAAHNAHFDVGFVAAELARCLGRAPEFSYVCTMGLRRPVGLPGPSAHKLSWACWQEGVNIEEAHAALCDARATGALLSRYLLRAQDRGMTTLGALNARGKASESWSLAPLQIETSRNGCATRARHASPRPANLHPLTPAPDEAVRSYLWHLAEAAADFEIDPDEVEELAAIVAQLRLTSDQVRSAHDRHLQALLDDRIADGLLTWAEEQEVRAFGRLLGVANDVVEAKLARAAEFVEVEVRPSMVEGPGQGQGLSVCFTGEFVAMPLTRDEVSLLASDTGMTVLPRVTKKLDVLVCLDANSQTTKAQKAREYGTVVIDQPTFLGLAGVQPAPPGVLAGVFEALAARRASDASEAECRREQAAEKNRERSRKRARERRESGPQTEQVLWCVTGEHEWTRAPQRGRPPKTCPEHTPVAGSPLSQALQT